jgi:hypothetical protein
MANASLIEWSRVSVGKPHKGILSWDVRLGRSTGIIRPSVPGLPTSAENGVLARSLTEALRERLRESSGLPRILIESICIRQIREPHQMPIEYATSSWEWNWFLSGRLTSEEDQDWETMRSELETKVGEVVAAHCEPMRAKGEAANRIEKSFRRSLPTEAT